MKSLALLLLLSGFALGAPGDGLKAWKAEQRRLAREEKKYWTAFQKGWVDADELFWRPWRDARRATDSHPNPVFDYSGHLRLYEDFVALQRARSKADLALAGSDDPKAAVTLVEELCDLSKRENALDAAILKGRPVHRNAFDQRPSVERHGLAVRHDGLVRAIATIPDVAEFLVEDGWARAVKKDGKRSVSRRVGVLDALGATRAPGARKRLDAALQAPEIELRIAAVEALLGFGKDAQAVLAPLLADPAPAVRRTLITGIRAHAADDPRWIAPLLGVYGDTDGRAREELVLALGALTNQTFGDAPALWAAWHEDYKKEIESGDFDRKKIEVREAKPVPVPGVLPFYRAEVRGRRVVFVLDGSRRMWWPADWRVQKTKYKYDWDRTLRNWEKEHASHQATVTAQLEAMLAGAPPEFMFNIVLLQGNFKTPQFAKKLVPVKRKKTAIRFLDKISGDGWCSPLEGLFAALRLGGVGPELSPVGPAGIDTIILVNSGDPSGGRYLNPDAVVAAFRRLNRFRRIVVHTVRIANDGDQAEALMKGLAEATGGTYVWAATPPG